MQDDRQMTNTSAAALTNNLADILERVLDKGIVIAGDIRIQLAEMDLLNIKIRLLVTSVDRAKELGIDWWKQDSFYSSLASGRVKELEDENKALQKKLKQKSKQFEQRLLSTEKAIKKDLEKRLYNPKKNI